MTITLDTGKNFLLKIFYAVTNTTEISDVRRRFIGIICMVVSVSLSLKVYTSTVFKNWWFYKEEITNVLNIQPTLTSTLCAIFLIMPLILRNKKNLSTYIFIITSLNILFCASFLSIFVGKEVWMIPFIDISSQSLLMFAVLISWVGMRSIAGFIWIGLFTIAITQIAGSSDAFGFAGVVYILCAFTSIYCQLADLKDDFLQSLKNDFFSATNTVKYDINAANTVITESVDKAVNAAGKIL